MGYPLAVIDATGRSLVTAASGPHGAGIKFSPPGVHGRAGGLARADTCAAHTEPPKSKSLMNY